MEVLFDGKYKFPCVEWRWTLSLSQQLEAIKADLRSIVVADRAEITSLNTVLAQLVAGQIAANGILMAMAADVKRIADYVADPSTAEVIAAQTAKLKSSSDALQASIDANKPQ